ncbi:acetolactate decarboxylase [Rosenbergiella australiborealis]|uniref:Alpha-acetolactate decarboxylase n=1 Tax=Rosenbergiella australiborealis TaxID=1544696 RepID=A0ABS5T613_9GAMM|nr:acetolactate decarboxylase [Rosenbergiella australiborealis]MBT0726418.1 acetolactate decarboxylase [Rosenbergiella australiborealis]
MSKITQYSTIGALMSGHLSGDFATGTPHNKQLFGLGCSCGISGELTVSQGQFWEATAGEPLHHFTDKHLPFLQVTEFVAEHSFSAKNVTDNNIDKLLSEQLPIANIFLAVNVKSCFDEVVIRRPQRDEKHSRTAKEMSEVQHVDKLSSVSGQLIGFWTPELFGRISVPGFHFHFLSDDEQHSGHVLSFSAAEATVDYQEKETIEIHNATSEKFKSLDIDITQLDELISQVEK